MELLSKKEIIDGMKKEAGVVALLFNLSLIGLLSYLIIVVMAIGFPYHVLNFCIAGFGGATTGILFYYYFELVFSCKILEDSSDEEFDLDSKRIGKFIKNLEKEDE